MAERRRLRSTGRAPGQGAIERVLLLHETDRWYFGDFLRHAVWLEWLRRAYPTAAVELASHPDYLPLYDDDRFSRLLDARAVDAGVMRSYDLVVVPAAYERPAPAGDLPVVLATWDAGWALYVRGRRQLRGTKQELNYFRAAHPSAVAGTRETAPSHIAVRDAEGEAAAGALARAFPGLGSVVVYNPTASNPFTRGTALPKEVDNTLSAGEHAYILHRLVAALPEHGFLVGSALKPGDTVNTQALAEVAALCRSGRVASITDLSLPGATTLRGFAALLSCERVCSAAGAGTGTNTHLAATTGTHSFSIEHGADAHMLANWNRPNDFQMGSFRWRNPSVLAAIHTMDWSARTPSALTAAAEAFLCHHALAHGQAHRVLFADPEAARCRVACFDGSWPGDPATAIRAGEALIGVMTAAARAHYGDFADEAAYLQVRYGVDGDGLGALVAAATSTAGELAATAVQLFEDSNLHKLLISLRTPRAFGPSCAGREVRAGEAAVHALG